MERYPSIPNVLTRSPITHKYTEELSSPEFVALSRIDWSVTEKIDGTNIRVIWDGKMIEVRGRGDSAQVPKPLHASLLQTLKPEFVRTQLAAFWHAEHTVTPECPLCIYGEGCGAGIQKGGIYFEDQHFIAFDAKLGKSWVSSQDVYRICDLLGIRHVPDFGIVDLRGAINMTRLGVRSAYYDGLAEGLVVRPTLELRDRYGHRIIGKIKTADFNR